MTLQTRLTRLEAQRKAQGFQCLVVYQDEPGATYHAGERHYSQAELEALAGQGVTVVRVCYASLAPANAA